LAQTEAQLPEQGSPALPESEVYLSEKSTSLDEALLRDFFDNRSGLGSQQDTRQAGSADLRSEIDGDKQNAEVNLENQEIDSSRTGNSGSNRSDVFSGEQHGESGHDSGLADGGGKVADQSVAVNEVPHVAEKPAAKNVLPFATRGKSSKPKPSLKSKSKSATRGKSAPVVEAGKGSKGTWQFRLRWNSEPGRPVIYVATVTDAVYDLIRKGDYDAYKRSIIASYEARTVSASHTA